MNFRTISLFLFFSPGVNAPGLSDSVFPCPSIYNPGLTCIPGVRCVFLRRYCYVTMSVARGRAGLSTLAPKSTGLLAEYIRGSPTLRIRAQAIARSRVVGTSVSYAVYQLAFNKGASMPRVERYTQELKVRLRAKCWNTVVTLFK